jgi:small subunit ribosomal protein S5
MAEENVSAAPAPAAAPQNQNRPNDRQRGGGPRGGRPGGGQGRRDNRDQTPEEKQFDERVIHIDRVARVVKGGRRFRFRALVVVGDRKGKVGIGLAKGADVTAAVAKATEVAKKHLTKIIRYKDTIPHEVDGKVAGARILIMPAAPGTGLIAGGVVRTILEVAGIGNALSKSFGSSNKSNIAYATLQALDSIEPAKNWVTTKQKAMKKAEPAKAAKTEAAKKPVANAKKEEK